MKTYLVPIDFSKTAEHAAEFAASLSHQTDVDHIILLNAYYYTLYETVLPNPDMVMVTEEEIERNAAQRMSNLEKYKEMLRHKVRDGVKISVHLNRSHLLRAVVENAQSKGAGLVILGSRGNSSNADAKIGSHVIKVSKACPVPVIVVPPASHNERVDRIVMACDFSKVTEAESLAALVRLLERKKFELLVVNINTKSVKEGKAAGDLAKETILYQVLEHYHPQYYFINDSDIINGILKFAAQHDAQMVIALPHKYSFLQSLLHNSIAQQLLENAAVPVLLLK